MSSRVVRESILWRWDGVRLAWLICLPEMRDYYVKHKGWKPLGTVDDEAPNEIQEVRALEVMKWSPEVRRRLRWRQRKRKWPPTGSTGE